MDFSTTVKIFTKSISVREEEVKEMIEETDSSMLNLDDSINLQIDQFIMEISLRQAKHFGIGD